MHHMAQRDRPGGKPGKDEFARLMADTIRAAGETAPVRYDAEQFQLVAEREGSHLFNLANAYREYCAAPPERRPDVLRRFSRSWFVHRREFPATLQDACPDLLPSIRSRAYFELGRLHIQVQGMGSPDWPYQPLAEHLGISLVYDLPDSIIQLQQHHLNDWKASFENALDVALHDLDEISRQDFVAAGAGVWRSPWRDNHDAARLLLPDRLRPHDVRGDPVAMVPNRDTLLLTGSDDEAGLVRLAKLAEEALAQPRPISGVAVRLDGDTWLPFLPEAGHPAHDALRLLRVQSHGADYGEQGELLRTLHEKTGEDIFIAAFSAVRLKDSGRVQSYSVWSAGVDTLLPRTDEVFFFRPHEDGKNGDIIGTAPWERVHEVAGDLMEPQGMYPERYRVRTFPSGQQLAAIGARPLGEPSRAGGGRK
jgi:hypothetical protein